MLSMVCYTLGATAIGGAVDLIDDDRCCAAGADGVDGVDWYCDGVDDIADYDADTHGNICARTTCLMYDLLPLPPAQWKCD